jgi:hypothetical protein
MNRLIALSVAGVIATIITAPIANADNFRTQSGRVLCAVTPDATLSLYGPDVVVCQTGEKFSQPGGDYSLITTGDGTFRWATGNINTFNPTTVMAYGQTYQSGNWSIFHDQNGTRFTNQRTGHGIFVSVDNVYAF